MIAFGQLCLAAGLLLCCAGEWKRMEEDRPKNIFDVMRKYTSEVK